MNAYLTLFDIAGFVALLLWGVHMVQTGIQRAFGPRLRTTLGVALGNRVYAFFAGLGVTAVLQSSTATGLIVAGFAANGLVGLVPALAAMLGANVGTTLIVQVLSFDISRIAPILVLIGVVMFRRGNATHVRDLGRVFIGLGLLLLSLHLLLAQLEPYRDLPALRSALEALSGQPGLAILLAAVLAWAAHSSVAIVVLVMSFSAQGLLPISVAFALVLGANLGTAINPLLEGSAKDDPQARRLPVGNLLNRVVGVLIGLAMLHHIHPWMSQLAGDNARAVANFHTVFNLVLAALFLPLLTPYAALLRRWLPANPAADPGQPLYLDSAARDLPVVALGNAAREALRMADTLQTMLHHSRQALATGDRKRVAEARRLDDVLDRLNGAIKTYVAGLDPDELTREDRRRADEILTFITNLEHAGDVVDKNLLNDISKLTKRGLAFSPEGRRELDDMHGRLEANLRLAASLFVTADARAARLLAAEKETFRGMEGQATQTHFERLRSGRVDTTETSALHLDVLRDLRRINSHLVASAAYAAPEVLSAPGGTAPVTAGAPEAAGTPE
ncbi:Na/Pi cotransporter family protein [Pigmentiphaga sp. H8]|uniref:Na/Pi cotransporter family protein n=1 Tax=Pigmentiphaga sp. H8 TaxID=2488560 RepID=UPI000F5A5936|nr:Na/Pi cotransporter family protein [Pigmentiphaga sp. H8]AZG09711.1 Na/Pi cotransporter family protein [Pigmentiphaga sp. H8]